MKKTSHLVLPLFFSLSFWGVYLPGLQMNTINLFPSRLVLPLAWLALATLLITNRNETRVNLKANPWLIPATVWLLYAIIALTWAANTSLALQHIMHLFLGISVLIIIPLLPGETLHTLWAVNAIAIIAVGAASLLIALENPLHPHQHHWLTPIFGNENNFAMFICLAIPFLAAQNKPIIRAISFTAIPVGVIIILMTTARLSYLALAILLILFVLKEQKYKLPILAAITLALTITLTLGHAHNNRIIKELQTIPLAIKTLADNTSDLDSSTSARVRITLDGLRMVKNTKYLGVGPGNFEHYMETKAIYQTTPTFNPHNWWVELLAEYGALILFLYLFTYIYIIVRTFKQHQQSKDNLTAAVLASLLIFPLLALAPSRLIWFSPHWLLLATAAANLNQKHSII